MEETDTADLKAVFEPRSIAVIGASRRPQTIGHRILENLIRNRYTGAVYPVNPQARVIHSIHAYSSMAHWMRSGNSFSPRFGLIGVRSKYSKMPDRKMQLPVPRTWFGGLRGFSTSR